MTLPLLITLWVVFCIVHSGLISVSATRILRNRLGERYCWFRLNYNLFSILTFVLLLIATSKIPGEPVFAWSGGLRVVQALLFALGTACFVIGGRNYDMRQFLGLNAFLRGKRPQTQPPLALATGLNALVRHPWYAGVFLLLWSGDQTTTDLAVNGVLSAYLVIGTILEERKLVLEFGEIYRQYQQEVSMFVPWRWVMKSLTHKTA